MKFVNSALIFSIAIISLYTGYFLYPGHLVFYIIFSVTFNGILFLSIKFKNPFLIFISILFWMGFWLKVTLSFYVNDGRLFEPVGFFNYSSSEYDYGLLLSSTGFWGFFLSQIMYGKQKSVIDQFNFISERKLSFYWVLFVALVIFFVGVNFEYSVFKRAVNVSTSVPKILEFFIQWALFVGFLGIALWMLDLSIRNKSKKLTCYLALVLGIDFLINVSMLSRITPVSSAVILFLFFSRVANLRLTLSIKGKAVIFITYICLSLLSILLVSVYRDSLYSDKVSTVQSAAVAQVNDVTPSGGWKSLLIGRWIGIEGVLATNSYPDKSLDFFVKSLVEKKNYSLPSFYDRMIVPSDTPYSDIANRQYYAISLPGIIGYLNYSGSLFFVFFGTFVLGCFVKIITVWTERVLFSPILVGYIGYLFAYRYVSFGYVPRDSYKFLFAVIFLILLITLFQKGTFLKALFVKG